MIPLQYRPLTDRSWLRSDYERRPHQFKADWASTLTLLERELEHLDAADITLEVDVLHASIRADGTGLKAHQEPATPAVVLSFESKHGPLSYRADAFGRATWRGTSPWRANVRAIALTLESLRAVDRYGATTTGEQYAGFLALEAGSGAAASHMTQDQACRVLSDLSGVAITPGESEQSVRARVRAARAAAHPDRHDGDRSLWDQVEQAAAVLGVAR